MRRSVFCLLLVLTVRSVLCGSCNGGGTYTGEGLFRGVGTYSSFDGTMVGVGTFTGEEDASFEGSADCTFDATVTSAENAQIIVAGSGVARGKGRFEDGSEVFMGESEVRGKEVMFDGVGSFTGKGQLRQSGAVTITGRHFKCLGSGRLVGDGTFEGRGMMEASKGEFTGSGNFIGEGTFVGIGSCSGDNVEMLDAESVEDLDAVDAQSKSVPPTTEPSTSIPGTEPSTDPSTESESDTLDMAPLEEELSQWKIFL